MPRDKKLLEKTISLVKEYDVNSYLKLPTSSYHKIAKDMINSDKMESNIWIVESLQKEKRRIKKMREKARKFGFAPFTNLSFYTYRWINEQYAGWILPLMKECLSDPEDVYSVWAVQFADAMDALGAKACCEARKNLFQFVTGSPAWAEATEARQEYLNDFREHKEIKKLQKSQKRKRRAPNTQQNQQGYNKRLRVYSKRNTQQPSHWSPN